LENNGGKVMKLRGKIVTLVLVPLVILGGSLFALGAYKVNEAMRDEVMSNLVGIAITAEGSLTQGSNVTLENGVLYAGGRNVSEEMTVLDEVKAETGVDVTIFYGDTRYATTVVGSDGQRVVGTQANSEIVDKVLKKGETYFAENVDVVGEKYFAYYYPMTNPGSDTPVGMVFAGKSMDSVSDEIQKILLALAAVAVPLFIVCAVVGSYVAVRIANSLKVGVRTLEKVADGDLTVKIPASMRNAKDETGDLSRAILKLKKSLTEIVGDIAEKSRTVHDSSQELDEKAEQTNLTVEQVESAVTDIASGATSQADETQRAMENVMEMGNMVAETHAKVENLTENATEMHRLGEEAKETLVELKEINEKTQGAIKIISDQTNTTNESATKIRQATSLIASIAEETNLLSLNASIEAARAGEQGRGFAVVAGQIQKLAEQSNTSTQQIELIIDDLIKESDKSVATMEEVNGIMAEQNEKIKKTDDIFNKVMDGIDESIRGVNVIAERTSKIDEARVNVVDVVQSLTAIAQQNAAGAEETSASVTEVTNIVGGVAQSATELKEVAVGLRESISVFTVDEGAAED
jgi:methyl-accepting chemotaxis protein